MSDITVKAYGLIPMKKRPYLIIQSVVFFIVIVLLVGVFALSSILSANHNLEPLSDLDVTLWIVKGALVLTLIGETIETIAMMAKFHQKEKEAKDSN